RWRGARREEGGGRVSSRGGAWPGEALEPVLAVHPSEVGVPDHRRVGNETLLEARPGFRRSQRLQLQLIPPQARVERLGTGEEGFERFPSSRLDDVVGVLTGGQ